MQCGVGRYFRAALQIRKNRPFPIKPHRKIIGNGRFWVYLEKWCTYIETHISHTDHSPTWEYLQVRSLGHQILTSHLQHYPGSSRIILDHSGPPQLIQVHPGSSFRASPAHPGTPRPIQDNPAHPESDRPIQPDANQPIWEPLNMGHSTQEHLIN